MKTIYIRGGLANNNAVLVLKEHLEEMGHKVTRVDDAFDCTVCWGRSTENMPSLNGRVNSFDKFEAFGEFTRAGVPIPHVFTVADLGCGENYLAPFPWLARSRSHTQGRDVIVVGNMQTALDIYTQQSRDFFSAWIPTETEYRVWVFRDRSLGVYEKVFKGEGNYTGLLRNARFGFKFVKRDDLRDHAPLIEPAIKAVKALQMDFGAVDVIEDHSRNFYVLEVNSKPDIENTKRSSGIRLARAISKWTEEHAIR